MNSGLWFPGQPSRSETTLQLADVRSYKTFIFPQYMVSFLTIPSPTPPWILLLLPTTDLAIFWADSLPHWLVLEVTLAFLVAHWEPVSRMVILRSHSYLPFPPSPSAPHRLLSEPLSPRRWHGFVFIQEVDRQGMARTLRNRSWLHPALLPDVPTHEQAASARPLPTVSQ